MQFSIITPMYNSFHLMAGYFKSLEEQTLKDFEVIVIDDCSTDDSYEKLLNYKTTSNLNLVIMQNEKNSGPGITRNLGLFKSRGQYLTFIDSDDNINQHYFQEINNIINQYNDVDCIIFDYYKQDDKKLILCSSIPNNKEGIINKKNVISHASGSTCCKVYRKKTVEENNIIFPDLMRFEDMVFNKLTTPFCDCIYYLKKPLYNYIIHENSIVHDERYVDIKYAISAFEIIAKRLKYKYPLELETLFIKELLYTTVLTLVLKKENKRAIINHIKHWEQRYPKWYKNSSIKDFSFHQKIILKLIQFKNINMLFLIIYLRKKNVL